MEEMGENAFRIMLQAIQQSGNGNHEQVVLPVRLIERQSCERLLKPDMQ
jgi:DNA-binding LacI/PurR family transcriptional regulator